MNDLQRCNLVLAGKTISLLTNDVMVLQKNKKEIEDAYNLICDLYSNKLDRESAFLFMLFQIIHEKEVEVEKIKNIIFLIENLCEEISICL